MTLQCLAGLQPIVQGALATEARSMPRSARCRFAVTLVLDVELGRAIL
jgi:hypothetical protein